MPLRKNRPSHAGVDARGISDFLDAAERDGLELHSLMIARHGEVIAEGWWAPYGPERLHLAYSVSKSFTATAIGLLVDEGRIGLDGVVLDHFPGLDGVPVDEGYRRLRVRHCLSMTTGHTEDMWHPGLAAPGEGGDPDPAVRRIFELPLPKEPGSVFTYNQVATYLLGAVIRAVTGADILDLLRERVLQPLGCGEVVWQRTSYDAQLAFSGIHVRTEAILALAQLHLDDGVVAGERLLSSQWVREATRGTGAPPAVVDPGAGADWSCGYGFSFWQARHGYRGDGAYGQLAIVVPDQDLAIAITSEVQEMQSVLDLLWAHVLPAVDRAGGAGADESLHATLTALALPALSSGPGAPPAAAMPRSWPLSEIWGMPGMTGTARVHQGDGGWELLLELAGREGFHADFMLPIGDGTWAPGEWRLDGSTLPVLCSGGWVDGEFAADIRIVETPHTVRLRSRDGAASLSWRMVPLNGPWPFSLAVRAG